MYMKFNQNKYIRDYNKQNYKMYQFRVKKDSKLSNILDNKDNRNRYIVNLIENDIDSNILTIKTIRKTIKPILNKYGIYDYGLFGSYARGEANNNSDIDIYCEQGNVKDLISQGKLIDSLSKALNKDVDIVFSNSDIDEFFKQQIMEDLIKIC